jgi:RNA polymerase sigma factor (sigma-70 family)
MRERSMGYSDNIQFEALYRAHARDIYAYCLRRTNSDEAKDATADVFVVAWRRIKELPDGEEALPWLFGVSRKVLANRTRSDRRRDRLGAKLAGQRQTNVPGLEPQIVRNEEHAALLAALAKLPHKDQEILRLIEWDGLTREQVAEMQYVSKAAIDKRVNRAYKRMARTLAVQTQQVLTTPVNVDEGGEA